MKSCKIYRKILYLLKFEAILFLKIDWNMHFMLLEGFFLKMIFIDNGKSMISLKMRFGSKNLFWENKVQDFRNKIRLFL